MRGYQNVAILAMFLVAMVNNELFIGVTNAQMICNMSGEGLMACRPSATRPNPPPPSAACCSALSNADMNCLCTYKNSSILPALGIDPKLAMQLPDKCMLPHPARC